MARLHASPRRPGAAWEEMSPLEYGLVAAFVLMALVAAVPRASIAAATVARLILERLS
jgi:hypothetical protein